MANSRPYSIWARSLLSPRRRLLPGVGRRLGGHPRLAAAVLVGLRRLPTGRLRALGYANVSRPLLERMDTRLVVPVGRGLRMTVDTTDMIGQVLAASGTWEPHVTAALPMVLSRGDVAVDVGAHVGYHTLQAAGLVGRQGRVYALEPSVSAFAWLESNIALNGLRNVRALRAAAGASAGRAWLVEARAGNTGEAAIRTAAEAQGQAAHEAVDVTTVAAVVEEADDSRLRLVKIDVEGHEAEVLKGVEPIFRRGADPTLIVEVHPQRAAEAIAALEDLRSAFGLDAFELVRPGRDRFARVPPPRQLPALEQVEALCVNRTVNVLLVPASRRTIGQRR